MNIVEYHYYYSVLTNGDIELEIIPNNRGGSCVDLPKGVKLSVLNNEYYLNDKKAWMEVKERKEAPNE